ncbi:PAS domain-containing sensor histidine kinase [Microbacterium oryzae]|uniref:sensor histidine kinase n=1 Tax=Microbacterium oryzae TaxID=743009 RepID=UPI0025AF251E|nr:PAS domain-containing sensor histidine kinase [Microbacterium oryzae]MDN3311640.1 PAS domain-containing sensor histidine kinase [Microbacterium oryzae]
MADGGGRTVVARAETPRREADRRTRSVWRHQLIIAFSTVTVATVVALLEPTLFVTPTFGVGLTAIILWTVLAIALPWHLLPNGAVLALPILDILAIGLLSEARGDTLGLLWAFPVVWLASYYSVGWLVTGICLVAGSILAAGLASGSFSTDDALSLFTLVLTGAFIGITLRSGMGRTRAAARLMRRQSRQLDAALALARREEQRRTALLDTLQTGIAQVDQDGTLPATNAAYRRMYGIENLPILHPTRAVEYRERRGEAIPAEQTTVARAARGENFAGEQVWLFDRDGRWRLLEVSARYRLDGMILVAEDVTAQTEAKTERQSMARAVSHELRSPLTAVLGHADLLLERNDLPASAREQLSTIENAAERMERLIARILQDPGRDPADEHTVVDLAAIASASVSAFGPAALSSGVRVVRPTDDDSAVIVGDAFRLRQVVDNVVGNAVKYTPRGGTVTVEVSSTAEEVAVSVADTGIGIPEDELSHIFDQYFRASSARDAGIPGTGLGMGISREIVTEHGGVLELDSALGYGTTVTIRLPRTTDKETA